MSYLNKHRLVRLLCIAGAMSAFFCSTNSAQTKSTAAQRKPAPKQTQKTKPPPPTELDKLRDSYIQTTKDLKESLQKLLSLYEGSLTKAEARQAQSQQLFKDGLISKNQVEDTALAVTAAKNKVTGVKQQIAEADVQIAQTLIEVEGDKQMAKMGRQRKGSTVTTASFIRFTGAGGWLLSSAGKIQNFFQQRFSRPLPVAVFGQGAIHDRWRLDHRNAMDISLNPDGVEGQALIEYLRANGIPFSAFRGAIPGVATGPHIHIGLPSHRY
jgi:hypothetical protein